MKGQLTLEYLLCALLFITTLVFLLPPTITHLQNTNNILKIQADSQNLNLISLNLGIIYTHSKALAYNSPPTKTQVFLDSNTLHTNLSAAYTLNPCRGAKYAKKDFIPN